MSQKNKTSASELVKTIIYAVIIAFTVRSVLYQPFSIPTESMVPTLVVGDYLFVSKYSYGYSRHSLPFSPPVLPKNRLLFDEPQRGDVAVFKFPKDNRTDFIKRIVGLPGDKIQVKGGILYINDKAVERNIDKQDSTTPSRLGVIRKYIETLPNGKKHFIAEIDDQQREDNTGVFYVPEKHYFAMGDNRDDSDDSRSGWFVPKENLVGRAEIIFFSVDKTKSKLWQIWKWPFAIRYDRLFQTIE